jgi:serine/threonine protein kinase
MALEIQEEDYERLCQHRTKAFNENFNSMGTNNDLKKSKLFGSYAEAGLAETEQSHVHTTDCGCIPAYQRVDSGEKLMIEDFLVIKILGKGTFGKVYLVSNKNNGKLYAMKSIRKDAVIEHNTIEKVSIEKLILLQVNHPFIINMEYVFIKEYRIYFLMDFVS